MEGALSFRLCIVSILPLFISKPVFSETEFVIYQNPAWHYVEKIKKFSVQLNDQVEDGCWINASRSKDLVELELLRSGSTISDAPERSTRIYISATGYASSEQSCAVNVNLEVYYTDTRSIYSTDGEFLSIYNGKLWDRFRIMTGPKSSMSERVHDAHQAMIQSFLVELSKNAGAVRSEILENAPAEKEEHWRSFIEYENN